MTIIKDAGQGPQRVVVTCIWEHSGSLDGDFGQQLVAQDILRGLQGTRVCLGLNWRA